MSETDTFSTKCSCDCQAQQTNNSASWEYVSNYYKQYGQMPPCCPCPPCPPPFPPWPPFPPPPPPPPPPPVPPTPGPDCNSCSDCKKEFPIIEGNKCFALDLNTFMVTEVTDANPGDYRLDKILFRKLEGGTFMMGSPDDEPGKYSQIIPDILDFERLHEETINSFNIGVFPVTQKQFEKVTGKKHGNKGCPCDCSKDKKDYGDPLFALPCRAKDFVSLDDVRSFINTVNEKLRQNEQFFKVELPTDAEWEFAARAGSDKPWSASDVSALVKDPEAEKVVPQTEETLKQYTRQATNLDKYASYLNGDVAFKVKHTQSRFPGVGHFKPNAFDLYDTLGCVWEWIDEPWRIWNKKLDDKKWLDDEGKANHLHTVRGGGYWFNADDCRCANRHGYPPSHRDYGFGFRLVLREVK